MAFTQQDVRLRQDTYCICLETGATHYGGVGSWRIADGAFELQLEAAAARELGVHNSIRILLASTVDVAALQEGLRRVFGA